MIFNSDTEALDILEKNNNIYELGINSGILFIPDNYLPTEEELDALNYLLEEWDFAIQHE